MIHNAQSGGKPLPTLTNPAGAAQILSGYQAINADGEIITGNIPSQGAQTITPGTVNKTIAAGRYLSGTQTIAGDSDLVANNIRNGVNLFGVDGNATFDAKYLALAAGDVKGVVAGRYFFNLPSAPTKVYALNLYVPDETRYSVFFAYPSSDGNSNAYYYYRNTSGTVQEGIGSVEIIGTQVTAVFPNVVVPSPSVLVGAVIYT